MDSAIAKQQARAGVDAEVASPGLSAGRRVHEIPTTASVVRCASCKLTDWEKFPSPPIDLTLIAGQILAQCSSEGIRMVRGLIRNQMLRKQLRVRVPCPPL